VPENRGEVVTAQDETFRLGFIGAGNIASAVVEGFCSSGRPCSVTLFDPDEQKVTNLMKRFSQVRRACSNQEVLDRSGLVVLAILPAVGLEILPVLRFREDHTVLSFLSTLPLKTVSGLVRPAERVFKVLPLPPVAEHLGLVPFFPGDPEVASCLRLLGEPMPLKEERELHLLWAITGLTASFYSQMEVIQGWCVAGGVDPESSRRYTASMYGSLANLAERKAGVGFDVLAREAATPGGLNEMALGKIKAGTTFSDLRPTLDGILKCFGETPVEYS
jgi:pyrroline-5-carboxylate reductase